MYQKVILIGNLGKSPELRYTHSGTAVASFTMATSKTSKDKDGNKQEKTQWHRITCWDETAKNAAKYLTKGSKVFIEGEIEYGEYEKDGIKRYTTDIHAFTVRFLDSKAERDARGGGVSQEDAAQHTQNQQDAASLPEDGQGAGPGGLPF